VSFVCDRRKHLALMCSGELLGWPSIRGHQAVYDRSTTQTFAFHNDKAVNREEGHAVGS
jgi:hypothetical protein